MAARVSSVVARARSAETDPVKALEDLFLQLYANVFGQSDDTQLLMRELTDNRARAGQAHSWPMRDFLDAIVAMVGKTPGGGKLTRAEALSRVYLLIGCINYAAVSEPTLRSMYDDAFEDLQAQFPLEVRRMVRQAFG